MAEVVRYLNRKEAAAWFFEQGLKHVTARHLSDLADRGAGPPYQRMGKHAYYAEADLAAWRDAQLRQVMRGRKAPKAA
jgi:hypothetical protein